jgi:hypothetical protein
MVEINHALRPDPQKETAMYDSLAAILLAHYFAQRADITLHCPDERPARRHVWNWKLMGRRSDPRA